MPNSTNMTKLNLIISNFAAKGASRSYSEAENEAPPPADEPDPLTHREPSAALMSYRRSSGQQLTIVAPPESVEEAKARAAANSGAEFTGHSVRGLRPRRPLALASGLSVTDAAKFLKAARSDAGLVVTDGVLCGIMTDSDVAKKVLAQGLEPAQVLVAEVMTSKPLCVMHSESASQALSTMIENRFRHLPVLDDCGTVEGLLSIDKCLYDAMASIDRLSSVMEPVSLVDLLENPRGVPKAMPPRPPRAINGELPVISASSTVLSVAELMARRMSEKRTGAILVEGNGKECVGIVAVHPPTLKRINAETRALLNEPARTCPCVGIVTPRDLLFRVVASGLPAASITVESIMTGKPDTIPADASILQALHQMQCGGYKHLPVLSQGRPVGVLDVLSLMEGSLLGASTPPTPSVRGRGPPAQGGGDDDSTCVMILVKCPQVPIEASALKWQPEDRSVLRFRRSVQQMSGGFLRHIVIMYDDDVGDRVVIATDEDLQHLVTKARNAEDSPVVHVELRGASKHLVAIRHSGPARTLLACAADARNAVGRALADVHVSSAVGRARGIAASVTHGIGSSDRVHLYAAGVAVGVAALSIGALAWRR